MFRKWNKSTPNTEQGEQIANISLDIPPRLRYK